MQRKMMQVSGKYMGNDIAKNFGMQRSHEIVGKAYLMVLSIMIRCEHRDTFECVVRNSLVE